MIIIGHARYKCERCLDTYQHRPSDTIRQVWEILPHDSMRYNKHLPALPQWQCHSGPCPWPPQQTTAYPRGNANRENLNKTRRRYALQVRWLFSECSLCVLWVCSGCVLCLCPGCSLCVLWVCSKCAPSVVRVCSDCALSCVDHDLQINWSDLERLFWPYGAGMREFK